MLGSLAHPIMRFFDLVTLAVALLQREGRVTYRALQRQFSSWTMRCPKTSEQS